MYKKINPTILILFLIFSILPIVSASYSDCYIYGNCQPVSASLGTFKQNDCVDIKTILNTTSVNISTISYPNSTIIVSNKAMIKLGYTFVYSFCNTSILGEYVYDYFDTEGNTYVNEFSITPNGEETSSGNAIFYIGLLFILLFFFGICVYSFMSIDNLLNRVAMIGLGYLIVTSISFIAWNMASDFLTSTPFLISMLRILFIVLEVMALPLLIGAFAWYVIMLFKIKQIDDLMKHGMSMDEAERRVKY